MVYGIHSWILFLDGDSTIVCDNGSYSLKVGFAGEHLPRLLIPTKHGKQRKEVSDHFCKIQNLINIHLRYF